MPRTSAPAEPRPLRSLVAAMALAALGLAAVACGSGDGGTTSTTTPASATTAPTSLATSPTGGTSATGGTVPTSCPPASEVNSALGLTNGAPTETQQAFGISCTYSGGGAVPTKIEFQQDTAATFAAGENAVPSATKVSGLGDAAYTTTGFLAVLNGGYSFKIVSPLSSTAQLEALGRTLVG